MEHNNQFIRRMSTFSYETQTKPSTKIAIACQFASEGDLDSLKKLGEKIDLSQGDYENRTPLMVAASAGHRDIVEYLLSKGVGASVTDKWGGSALSCAIKFERDDITEILKKYLSSGPKTTLWNCENDDVSLILFNDFKRGGSVISATTYGCTASEAYSLDHDLFFKSVQVKGVKVMNVSEAILINSSKYELSEFVISQLVCETAEDDKVTFDEIQKHKRDVGDGMSYEQLMFAITHKITLYVGRRSDGTLYTKSYGVEPVVDLLTRRYQIVTTKGVILMGAETHKHSVSILKFCFKKLGLPVLLSLPDPLRLCGNDYIPAGPDLCFMGTGIKTNEAAVRYLLQKDVFGTKRVAMVRDIFQRSASHCLDRVIKMVSNNCFVILQDVMGKDNIYRRLVTEYVRMGRKDYVPTRSDVELSEYLVSLGYHLIILPSHLGGERIYNAGGGKLSVRKKELADIINLDPNFKGTVEVVENSCANELLFENSYLPFRRPVEGSHLPLDESNLTTAPKVWDTGLTVGPHQTANTVLMVAPVGFQTNAETAADNFYMKKVNESVEQIERNALIEFSGAHRALTDAGIQVVLFSSERFHGTPDAVFPNNWFTTHAASEVSRGSTVVFYPMKTPTRRAERRQYIVSQLQSVYQEEISFSQWENEDFPHFLEGTGALIMDRVRKVAYAALSRRCYRKIAHTWAERLGYKLILFKATDSEQRPIYHTNVMMSVGTTLAIVCMESIKEGECKEELKATLSKSHQILEITRDQVCNLCGNVLELSNKNGQRFWVISERARRALSDDQVAIIKKHCDDIISPNVDTIETIGGGGLRCMLGELF